MSWLFSQALVAEFSEEISLDGEPFAQLNVMPTAQQFWRNDKMMDASRLSQFGLTLRLLTVDLGVELLMSFLAAFPAKTFQSQDADKVSAENVADYGRSSHGSLAKYDPVTRSLKTAQLSLIEGSTLCSPILPRWGSMQDGELFQQPMLVLNTCANESGLWQTPVADDAVNRKIGKWNSRGEPKLSAQVMLPAPSKLLWPTPTVHGNHNKPGASVNAGWGLSSAVKSWPTPTVSMLKGSSRGALLRKDGRSRANDRLDHATENSGEAGRLNPQWVEWLMGWPLGWTDLKPLAMDRFREWQQQHSPCYRSSAP